MTSLYSLYSFGHIAARIIFAGIATGSLYLAGIETGLPILSVVFLITALLPKPLILAVIGALLKLLGMIEWSWLGVLIPAISAILYVVAMMGLNYVVVTRLGKSQQSSLDEWP